MKIIPMSARKIEQSLYANGFAIVSTAKHNKWRHPDGRWTCTPKNGTVSRNIVSDVLRQTGLSREAFFR